MCKGHCAAQLIHSLVGSYVASWKEWSAGLLFYVVIRVAGSIILFLRNIKNSLSLVYVCHWVLDVHT